MALHEEWIRYGTDKSYLGYVAVPAGQHENLPAVIVIQEIWGVDGHIQDVTRRFAQAGYYAIAPDLYAAGGERPAVLAPDRVEAVKQFLQSLPPTAWHNPTEREEALNKLPGEEKQRVGETFSTLFGGLQLEKYVPQLRETVSYLKVESSVTKGQHVGTVGFCMGGALSGLMAGRDNRLSASVIFYGNAPGDDDIKAVSCPVMGFYGSLDARITDQVPGFAEKMKQAGKRFDYHVYEGAHHAFFNDTRTAYHVSASRDAFARTLEFFRQNLG